MNYYYDHVTINPNTVIAYKGALCAIYFVLYDKSVDLCFGNDELGASMFYTHATLLPDRVRLHGTDMQSDNEIPLDDALRAALVKSGFTELSLATLIIE
jgi:hypothetical protein